MGPVAEWRHSGLAGLILRAPRSCDSRPEQAMKPRHVLLLALTACAVALALLLPAMPQPLAYHNFADRREAYGIGNFLDVASNISFAVAGLAVLAAALAPGGRFARAAERLPYAVFALGLLLTAAGSCYYHLEPNNESLFWDRLPMTIAFMALIASQLVDRVDMRVGLAALVPLLLIGLASVVYWISSERVGNGNVVPYAVLQGYAVVVLPKLVVFHPSRYSHGRAIYAVFVLYVLAKGFEHYDREIFAWTGVVSGHSLKHVAAGLAGLPVALMLWRRRANGSGVDSIPDPPDIGSSDSQSPSGKAPRHALP
jgi:hypothetical protein